MASAYPGGLDNFPTTRADGTATPTNHPTDHNDANDAINKIEAELGITPSGPFSTVAARLAFSGARVRLAADVTLTDNVEAAVAWNTEDFDTDGYWAGGAATRFTAPFDGFYRVSYSLVFGATTVFIRATIQANGAGVRYAPTQSVPLTTGFSSCASSDIIPLSAAEFVEVMAWLDSDSNEPLVGSTGSGGGFWSSTASITFLGT